jgi:hypothetical protein
MEIFIGRKVGILGDSGESNGVAVCSLEDGLAAVPSASFEATDPGMRELRDEPGPVVVQGSVPD